MVYLNTFILLFLVSANAHARFLVEPSYIHYSGEFKAGSEKGNFVGKVAGLNVGYLGEYFMAGISLEKGQYTYDNNITSNGYSQFDGGGVGTFIAFHFWDYFRLWTGYLNSTLEPVDNNDIRYFGQHISVGLGFRLYEGLMLNFQDFRNQFTQIEDDVTGKTTGLDTNIRVQGLSASLSYILIF